MDIRVLVPISQGTEELEAIAIIDLLRRAGINVKVAGENEIVTCSKGIKIIPDLLIDSVELDEKFDAIIIPGGLEGVNNLISNLHFNEIIKNNNKQEIYLGAICAAPLVLLNAKIIDNNDLITCHPSIADQFNNYKADSNVVVIGNIITSRGAGTSIDFALKIIELLINRETAKNIANNICYENYE